MRRACVIGWPVEHSRSPLIHGHWLGRYGIEGEYGKVAVPPGAGDGAGAAAFLRGLARAGYVGCNVTLPHKEAAFAAVDERSATAEAVGAVNTCWLAPDGRVIGDNTDVHGFLANLDEGAPGWDSGAGMALVIGAGGAARAVVHGLGLRGFAPILVLNRTPDRAAALAADLGGPIEPGGLDALRDTLGKARLVVNTTSAGLHDGEPLALDWGKARDDAVATDLTYVPLVTPFLAGAAARGLRIVDGLGMLLHQAAPGFERWFGPRPEVGAELRRLVLADLGEG